MLFSLSAQSWQHTGESFRRREMKTEIFSISMLLTIEKGEDHTEVVRKLWEAMKELELPVEDMTLSISKFRKEAELDCE